MDERPNAQTNKRADEPTSRRNADAELRGLRYGGKHGRGRTKCEVIRRRREVRASGSERKRAHGRTDLRAGLLIGWQLCEQRLCRREDARTKEHDI